MADIKPEIVEMSIVVVGSFEPYYMTPSWFTHHGLFSEEEGKSGELHFQSPDFLHCTVGWAEIIVDRTRVQIKTMVSPYIRLKDFACKLLSEVINSKPILQIGINYSAHFPMNFAQLEKLGNKLAPREPWGNWGGLLKNHDHKEKNKNGLLNITMRQRSSLEDRKYGHIDARVETSKLMPNDAGAHVFINDHYDFVGEISEVDNKDLIQDANVALEAINNIFDASICRSENIAVDVINGAMK